MTRRGEEKKIGGMPGSSIPYMPDVTCKICRSLFENFILPWARLITAIVALIEPRSSKLDKYKSPRTEIHHQSTTTYKTE